ncbi:MAG: DinB family protein [Blastocatellia bacterium]|nr:DinB family protein [Blastocatellia bacterium]
MMSEDYSKLSLKEIIAEAEAISREAQERFLRLNSEQLNWKPTPESWSIAQCIDHLITSSNSYFPQFDQIIGGKKKTTLLQSLPFLPGIWGRLLIKALSPNSNRKFKAPQSFQPASSKIDPQIISKFAAQQNELIGKIRATEGRAPEKVIISSTALKIVTYSLLDAYRILLVHERRHFKQAQRVMEAPGFPGESIVGSR